MPKRELLLSLIVAGVLFSLGASGCGGSKSASIASLARLTAVGFLPTPKPTARPAGARDGYFGTCPPFPQATCAVPGDRSNLYTDLGLGSVSLLHGHFCKDAERYVSARAGITKLLQVLDTPISAEQRTIADAQTIEQCLVDRTHFHATMEWPPGSGPFLNDATFLHLDFDVDLDANTLTLGTAQWHVPQEFVAAFRLDLAANAPAPTPTPPGATAAPAPTIVEPRSVFFSGPDDQLKWDGPDDRVASTGVAHCGDAGLRRDFGVPVFIRVDSHIGFWSIAAVRREEGWRWTGYYHDGWQIWQGDDPGTIYLVYGTERRVAFKYMTYGCI